MKITFYNSKSKENQLDKSSLLTEINSIEGVFKSSQSILTPSILVDLRIGEDAKNLIVDDSLNIVVDDNLQEISYVSNSVFVDLLKSNYCYIEELSRYYYITDIRIVNSNLAQFELKVDPLMSFKDEILSNYLLISRNYTNRNLLLDDSQTRFLYDKKIEKIEIDNTGDVQKLNPELPSMIFSYITSDAVSVYQSTQKIEGLPNVSAIDCGLGMNTQYYRIYTTDIFDISSKTFENDKILSYIKSITLYPFDVSCGNYIERTVHIGASDSKNELTIHGAELSYIPYRLVVADFTMSSATSYLDYSPYSVYKIFVPYCDFVQLSGEAILGKHLMIFYSVNFDDGASTAYIYNVTDNKILYSQPCYLSTKISLSSTNQMEINDAKTSLALNTGISCLTGAVAIAGGVASGNPLAVIGGGVGITKALTNQVTKSNQLYDQGSTSSTSLVDGTNNIQTPYIEKITQQKLTDSYYRDDIGYPLSKSEYLSRLVGSGITYIDSSSHVKVPNATKSEIDEIENSLHNGVIL